MVTAPPRVKARIPMAVMGAVALMCMLAWYAAAEMTTLRLHPRLVEMLAAARTAQSAARLIATEKTVRGIMQPTAIDPNQTGLIGPEYTEITTTLGDLGSKRTVTNPDLAAALVKMIDTLGLPHGAPVLTILSGSFVGADIATLAAIEALGLRPIIILSLGASMYGATDPGFNLVDMFTLIRRSGLIGTDAEAAVLGGEQGLGTGMDAGAVSLLRASAAAAGIALVEEAALAPLIDRLMARIGGVLGDGALPRLVINAGGAQIAIGSCPQSFELKPGLNDQSVECGAGVPGIAMRFSGGVPVLHIINIRRMALEMGLPFDPRPLPKLGKNAMVYGTGPSTSDQKN